MEVFTGYMSIFFENAEKKLEFHDGRVILIFVVKEWMCRMVEEVVMESGKMKLSFRADKRGSLELSFF